MMRIAAAPWSGGIDHISRARWRDVRHRGRGRLGRSGLDQQRADAVAVDAEILVAALRDDDFVARLDHHPNADGILVEAAAEALVGDVDERDQPAFRDRAG